MLPSDGPGDQRLPGSGGPDRYRWEVTSGHPTDGTVGVPAPDDAPVPAAGLEPEPEPEPAPAADALPPRAVAIVVAAGAGVRMGAERPKALMEVAGRPMVAWSVAALAASSRVTAIVVVAPPGHEAEIEDALEGVAARVRVTAGGESRAESVRAGLAAAPGQPEQVLVHDAARPLLRPELVDAVLDGLDGAEGAVAAAPVADTLKRAGETMMVGGTVERGDLWAAQTPQAFWTRSLRRAVDAASAAGVLARATDCATLVEQAGGTVRLVPSLAPNLKVTTPADLAVAEALLGFPPTSGP
jgi:2-C-methyl-D-erythritol 4-phosphate cytidylyltransferase